jgi:hypothetical protein
VPLSLGSKLTKSPRMRSWLASTQHTEVRASATSNTRRGYVAAQIVYRPSHRSNRVARGRVSSFIMLSYASRTTITLECD